MLYLFRGVFMEYKGNLTEEQKLILKDIDNPTVTKIIELANKLNVSPVILVKYFIQKELLSK